MKFRCPYCHEVFEPQASSLCPACGKAMAVPRKLRPDAAETTSKGKRLSPEMRQKQRELKQGVSIGATAWANMTKNPRYVAALVILFVVLGIALTQQVTRRNTETVHRFDPLQHATDDLTALRTALELFHKDCGRYPSTRESLVVLLRRPRIRGWDGPYIKTLIPDPWKHSYRYTLSKGLMRLTSDGPDGKPDTADDIKAPPPDMNVIYPTNTIVTPGQIALPVP